MQETPSLFNSASHHSPPVALIKAPSPPTTPPLSTRTSLRKKSRHFEIDPLFDTSPPQSNESSGKSPPPPKKDPPLPRDFALSTPKNSEDPEYYRIRRKAPYPPVLDDLILNIVKSLPRTGSGETLCEGSVFPAIAASCSSNSDRIVYSQEDPIARKIVKGLVGKTCAVSFAVPKRGSTKFSLVVSCLDDFVGKILAEKIISLSDYLEDSGILLVAVPSDYLLDYTTSVRNEAPLIRDGLHKKYKTHFILRPTGPLMQPAWDILVLTQRFQSNKPVKNKWRITGTGFLPWQKCNEAISSSPWLLVESLEQIPTAVARCVNYPWEAFGSSA